MAIKVTQTEFLYRHSKAFILTTDPAGGLGTSIRRPGYLKVTVTKKTQQNSPKEVKCYFIAQEVVCFLFPLYERCNCTPPCKHFLTVFKGLLGPWGRMEWNSFCAPVKFVQLACGKSKTLTDFQSNIWRWCYSSLGFYLYSKACGSTSGCPVQ